MSGDLKNYIDILSLTAELEREAVQKGYLSAQFKRFKYGSKQYKANNEEYDRISLRVVEIQSEIQRRVLGNKEIEL